MVGRALGYSGKQRITSFKDVPSNYYSSGYIQTALEKKLITQNSTQTFRPKERMTRGEMAYLLQNAFQLTGKSAVSVSDVSSGGSLYDAVNAIITAGLSNGYPDGSFKPNNAMTRTEFSLFVARALNEQFRISNDLKPIGEATVNADFLNVRSTPTSSTNDNIIGSLSNGTHVTIFAYEGDWAYVSYSNTYGYVHRSYLSFSSEEKIVAIDAGHGDGDPGASGNGVVEKKINLSVALKVQKILEQKGIKVVMTRKDDTFLELDERVKVAVDKNADTFVSIHSNSATDSRAKGTETYYSTAALNTRAEMSKQLATFIQDRLYKALDTSNRGVKQANFRVITKTPLPAALVELGFVTNSGDAAKLASDTYQNKAAEAIALGIVDYYNWRK
jgi:N-acetylmuramoyl-L-alanine amidase